MLVRSKAIVCHHRLIREHSYVYALILFIDSGLYYNKRFNPAIIKSHNLTLITKLITIKAGIIIIPKRVITGYHEIHTSIKNANDFKSTMLSNPITLLTGTNIYSVVLFIKT